MLEFTDAQFEDVRRRAEEHYQRVGKIRCPYFQEPVHFSTDGLRHLLFKTWNRGRPRQDQFMRLRHLAAAQAVIRQSRTVQGILETQEWERRKRHGRWERLLRAVTYYEFVAVLDSRRFKVIVKQVSGGERQFWSLIPHWRQNPFGPRFLHDGDPALD
jgi:hypothetical protein